MGIDAVGGAGNDEHPGGGQMSGDATPIVGGGAGTDQGHGRTVQPIKAASAVEQNGAIGNIAQDSGKSGTIEGEEGILSRSRRSS